MTTPLDDEAQRLLADLVALTHEAPEAALRAALAERLQRVRRELELLHHAERPVADQTDELFGY